ncbi:hypothetical protein LLQ46_22955 [Rouxiella badensis]|nr:hypothetical protein [Rouxiella badensis]MCC3717944.1 hypothetical protein [Rouxiella badensis]MCC3730041.1 hypothetical protein [Rouxiella badensis]MCC3749721.1 hypothetical protein [Rouxiella badensis]
MHKRKIAPMKLNLDASEVVSQVEMLIGLFKLKTAALESVPEHVVNLFFDCISSLANNIVLEDFSPTVTTKNIDEICIKMKIIRPTHLIATAIRTGDLESLSLLHD